MRGLILATLTPAMSATSGLSFWPQRIRPMAAHLPHLLGAANGASEAVRRPSICNVRILYAAFTATLCNLEALRRHTENTSAAGAALSSGLSVVSVVGAYLQD